MRTGPRGCERDGDDPKIVCLRNPARKHHCGRFCLGRGQENFIRMILQSSAEAAS
jgi:hypothetical protein